MLSYQHIYHAGNFADVHKHTLLVKTLSALKNKSSSLCVLDTHAGRGMYDLSAPEAQKKEEFKNGILSLWNEETGPLADYTQIVQKYNPHGKLESYPGSPCIIRDMLRPADSLILSELHPAEFTELEKTFEGVKNTLILKNDGFAIMNERMPPDERHGMIVIDPPYEIKTDYVRLPRQVEKTWKKWPQGVFFIWYPILTTQPHLDMLTALRRTTITDILISEIRLEEMPKEGFAMYGSGIAIINPPLPGPAFEETTHYIAKHLPAKASGNVFWLANKPIDPHTSLIEM
jgi:23S rRNA (adenine2030-N6)-methyltransferase